MHRFQAKGVHDHQRPEAKSTAEARRSLGTGRRVRGITMFMSRESSLSTKVSSGKTTNAIHDDIAR